MIGRRGWPEPVFRVVSDRKRDMNHHSNVPSGLHNVMATDSIKRTGTLVVMMVAVAAVLSACGRAGPPMKPSQAAIERAKEAKETPPEAPVPNSENEDKRFILDGLLE